LRPWSLMTLFAAMGVILRHCQALVNDSFGGALRVWSSPVQYVLLAMRFT